MKYNVAFCFTHPSSKTGLNLDTGYSDEPSNAGGCNGCVNKEDPENDGLIEFIEDLEAFYPEQKRSKSMSRYFKDSLLQRENTFPRADLWVLAGIVAVNEGIKKANAACKSNKCKVPRVRLVFRAGRKVRKL